MIIPRGVPTSFIECESYTYLHSSRPKTPPTSPRRILMALSSNNDVAVPASATSVALDDVDDECARDPMFFREWVFRPLKESGIAGEVAAGRGDAGVVFEEGDDEEIEEAAAAAGLSFPVEKIEKELVTVFERKFGDNGPSPEPGEEEGDGGASGGLREAAVYLAAVLEYCAAEVAEISGIHAHSRSVEGIVPVISPLDVRMVFASDDELAKVFSRDGKSPQDVDDAGAQSHLGDRLFRGHIAARRGLAKESYCKSADQGYAPGQHGLGMCFFEGVHPVAGLLGGD
jgi:TPR repeat protein